MRDGNLAHGPAERPTRDTDSLERRVALLEQETKTLRSEVETLRAEVNRFAARVERLEALDGLHELGVSHG